jgi:malate/lactate dehydrogenase
MREVAIVGAGELGGLVAHAIARRNIAPVVRLIDPDHPRIAEGKALDITQAGAVEGFAAEVHGAGDLSTTAGADVVVLADAAGGTRWTEEDELALVGRIRGFAGSAAMVCAGASSRPLVERAVQLRLRRTEFVGSAPEALGAAARALVALETDVSPSDVALSIIGVPPSHVVAAWEDASVGGFAAVRVLSTPARRRLAVRIAALWPPGPYALANAAAKVVQVLGGHSRRSVTCFVAPEEGAGSRMRAAALPVRRGSRERLEIVVPELSPAERVALDNAMLL